MGKVRIGTSGWSYRDWNTAFYPDEVKAKDRLGWISRRFPTLEINASFYRMPGDRAVAAWKDETPDDFVFAWKASRFITHNKKLNDPHDPLAYMFERARGLGDKLGPVLFQLPPNLHRNLDRLETFLKALRWKQRYVIEFRHHSWYADEVLDLLRERGIALCLSDHHDAPSPWELTADFVYVRAHGPGGRYHGRYGDGTLKDWARQVRDWGRGRDVFLYFDNDQKSAAPADAQRLMDLLEA
ncbi:MAG: DUF72 domain-containing protein [Brevundimonas sp.]